MAGKSLARLRFSAPSICTILPTWWRHFTDCRHLRGVQWNTFSHKWGCFGSYLL